MAPVVTRFAPSPTGFLHSGHAYSALFAARAAQRHGGRFLLRIEDIDRGRCRKAFEDAIFEDLAWLGLTWPEPVRRQSQHLDDYQSALDRLNSMGLLYRCFLSRRDLDRALSAPHRDGSNRTAPFDTDRMLSDDERARRLAAGEPFALRLRVRQAMAMTGPLDWVDHGAGRQIAIPDRFGDVVLARKEFPASYHLAVTVDDAIQGVTLVTRGTDLFEATHVHRLLQALLDLPAPEYHHHALLADAGGRRLAKRTHARTLRSLRDAGDDPYDVLDRIGMTPCDRVDR